MLDLWLTQFEHLSNAQVFVLFALFAVEILLLSIIQNGGKKDV